MHTSFSKYTFWVWTNCAVQWKHNLWQKTEKFTIRFENKKGYPTLLEDLNPGFTFCFYTSEAIIPLIYFFCTHMMYYSGLPEMNTLFSLFSKLELILRWNIQSTECNVPLQLLWEDIMHYTCILSLFLHPHTNTYCCPSLQYMSPILSASAATK